MTGFADAHLHADGTEYEGSDSAELMSVCSAGFEDWDMVRSLTGDRIVKSYGVHPWHSDVWTEGSVDRLRKVLEEDPAANVGEIGLDADNGPEDMIGQATCFEEQFLLASQMGRAVTIHNVRCENWVLASIKRNHKGCRAVVLHSFSGPESYVKSFCKYGCYFSIAPRLLSKQEDRIKAILLQIPRDRILVETDSPSSGPNFESMDAFIDRLAQLLSMTSDELRAVSLENAKRAFL